MIITCPHCSARYRVKDDMIPAKGKRIRCKKCSAVFVAYRDKPEVLERKPEGDTAVPAKPKAQAAPAKPAPPTAPATPAAPAGATVKVDRSQLDQFLQQNNQAPAAPASPEPPVAPAAPAASTVKIDGDQYQQFLANQTQQDAQAGATVQVDRSQINAFLQSQGDEDGATIKMDDGATVQMSNDALSGLVDNTAPTAPTTPAMPEMPADGATMKIDANSLSSALASQEPPVPDFGGTGDPTATVAMPTVPPPAEMPAPAAEPAPEMDAFKVPDEPAFPSDDELGIGQETPAFEAPPEPSFDPPPAPEPVAAQEPFPEPPAPAETLYTALVEGSSYPNLKLDAIERWIREGRLLADDQLAIGDGQDFQAANSFAEVAELFAKYDSQFHASAEAEPPKKKGFFAKLFGFGK